jgi:hypothetical protein
MIGLEESGHHAVRILDLGTSKVILDLRVP